MLIGYPSEGLLIEHQQVGVSLLIAYWLEY